MEVHHHSHSEGKGLKNYLFQFFMLFLAVFSGFLAEYFLEHIVERHREKEFIQSMVMDLKEDTTKITGVINFNRKQTRGLDSLFKLLMKDSRNKDSIQKAYRFYYNYALNYDNVVFTDRTMTQLKNSGGLRLIRNQKVSDSIMNYDSFVKGCNEQFEVIKRNWESESNYSYTLFDLERLGPQNETPIALPNQLLSTKASDIRGYSSRLLIFTSLIRNYSGLISTQKGNAVRLIAFLREEYNLN
ncbi:MAG: hypothetical protein ABI168_01950 [Ginsengibacter sp.]